MSSRFIHIAAAAATAKSLQSCPTLCDPIDGSPPGSPIPGILQARTLEWVAISFSNAWKWKVKVKSLSRVRVRLLATPWTAAYQAPPSTGVSRQEYWSGVPLPSPPYSSICQKFLTFFKVNNILLYVYTTFVYPIICRGHLVCFCLLATVNYPTMRIASCANISFKYCFQFFWIYSE